MQMGVENIPTNKMLRPTGLTALISLGLLAESVVAAPSSIPRSDASVSLSYRYLVSPPESL